MDMARQSMALSLPILGTIQALVLFVVRRARLFDISPDRSASSVRGREMKNMANMDVRAWRASEMLSQSPTSAMPQSDDALNFSNDDFDFPPTAHPVRELVTASIFVLAVILLMVGGGSKLL
jgi:hypothetical protein